jgi:hypothetical protein
MFRGSLIVLICATSTSRALAGEGQLVFNIMDFGAKPDCEQFNTAPVVQKALEAIRKQGRPAILKFPNGRYDFRADGAVKKKYHVSNTSDLDRWSVAIMIDQMKDLTVDGDGSEFIFHGQITPFAIEDSENIWVRNVNMDWDIPLTAECTILAVEKEYIDVAIDPTQFPYVIENDRVVFVGEDWKARWNGIFGFDGETGLLQSGRGDVRGMNKAKAEELKKGKVRFHLAVKEKNAVPGTKLVLRHSNRFHPGTFVFHSRNIGFKDVNMYHAAGLGFVCQYSENIVFNNANVHANTKKGRTLSGHDDGLQVSNCKGFVRVENCHYYGLMDDPINVHGTSVRIIERRDANTLKCSFMHAQSIGMDFAFKGDRISFIENETMVSLGTTTVKAIKHLDAREFLITLEDKVPVDIQEGDALENLTWAPDLTIRNCHFGSCRARGLLISTPGKVLVENNLFESSGSAILIAGDANGWYESGAVKDVMIRKNTFRNCLTSKYQFCHGIISIDPIVNKTPRDGLRFHRNIRIENNKFINFGETLLYAKSVEGLTFADNVSVPSELFGEGGALKPAIVLNHCRTVKISGNKIESKRQNKCIKLMATKRVDVDIKNDVLSVAE